MTMRKELRGLIALHDIALVGFGKSAMLGEELLDAILARLEQPTPGMLEIGAFTVDAYYSGSKDADFEGSVRAVFQAMIRAIREEGE